MSGAPLVLRPPDEVWDDQEDVPCHPCDLIGMDPGDVEIMGQYVSMLHVAGKSNPCSAASVEKWTVAAHGPEGPGCGLKIRVRCSSPKCRHVFEIESTCKDRRCPKCGVSWASHQGALAAWRMVTVGRAAAARGAWGRQAIVGLARAYWDEVLTDPATQGRWRAVAGGLAVAMGFRGFSLIFHPFRDSKEKGHYDIEGPHWHVIGWADKLGSADEIPARWTSYRAALESGAWFDRLKLEALPVTLDDWIFHGVALEDGTAKRYKSWGQFYKALNYELSHAGIIDRAHAITYLGICHWRVTPMTTSERKVRGAPQGTLCPKCGSPAFPVAEREPAARPADIVQHDLNGATVPKPATATSRPIKNPRAVRWSGRDGRYVARHWKGAKYR